MRLILLVLANLALPFVLWGLRNWYYRWQNQRRGVPDAPLPALDGPRIIKLLLWGVLCLALSLFASRLWLAPPAAEIHGQPSISGDY